MHSDNYNVCVIYKLNQTNLYTPHKNYVINNAACTRDRCGWQKEAGNCWWDRDLGVQNQWLPVPPQVRPLRK